VGRRAARTCRLTKNNRAGERLRTGLRIVTFVLIQELGVYLYTIASRNQTMHYRIGTFGLMQWAEASSLTAAVGHETVVELGAQKALNGVGRLLPGSREDGGGGVHNTIIYDFWKILLERSH